MSHLFFYLIVLFSPVSMFAMFSAKPNPAKRSLPKSTRSQVLPTLVSASAPSSSSPSSMFSSSQELASPVGSWASYQKIAEDSITLFTVCMSKPEISDSEKALLTNGFEKMVRLNLDHLTKLAQQREAIDELTAEKTQLTAEKAQLTAAITQLTAKKALLAVNIQKEVAKPKGVKRKYESSPSSHVDLASYSPQPNTVKTTPEQRAKSSSEASIGTILSLNDLTSCQGGGNLLGTDIDPKMFDSPGGSDASKQRSLSFGSQFSGISSLSGF